MYLGELNATQKDRFLDLGIRLAATDGDFSEAEKEAIHLLCDEMSIADRYDEEASPEEAIRFSASETDRRVQRIVVFELLGISLADNVYHDRKQELMIVLLGREASQVRRPEWLPVARLLGAKVSLGFGN